MADAKITDLADATLPLAGTELVEVVQGGANVKVATSQTGRNLSLFRQIRALDATARYLLPMTVVPSTGTIALSAGRIYYMPFEVEILTDGLAFEVTTAGTAGSTARMGIYGCLANGLPGALIVEGTPVSIASTGIKIVTLASNVRVMGPCWLAFSASAAVTVRAGTVNADGVKKAFGHTTLSAASGIRGVQNSSSSFAALPNPATYDFDHSNHITLALRGAV